MTAYPSEYLNDVVETQGKLFQLVAEEYPESDTEDFIEKYMNSKTRQFIDEGQVYVNTMDTSELWEYFSNVDRFKVKPGQSLKGFLPDWIGQFYAYYQWFYNLSSSEVLKRVPISFLKMAYPGLHDLDLQLAVQKVGNQK